MNKEDAILKLENELYNPQPKTDHILLEKIYYNCTYITKGKTIF